jgi:hypothetical protein
MICHKHFLGSMIDCEQKWFNFQESIIHTFIVPFKEFLFVIKINIIPKKNLVRNQIWNTNL